MASDLLYPEISESFKRTYSIAYVIATDVQPATSYSKTRCKVRTGAQFDSNKHRAMGLEEVRHFGWVDYLLFVAILLISSLIGVYHAWRGSSSSTSEYLMGGKSMGIFPIAMSLAAR